MSCSRWRVHSQRWGAAVHLEACVGCGLEGTLLCAHPKPPVLEQQDWVREDWTPAFHRLGHKVKLKD